MKKLIFLLIFLCLPLFLPAQEIVEKIEIEGNERVTNETILYYLSSREGDYFNKELLKRDFMVLWATGFFSNIIIEENGGTQGKIIKIIIEENPVIKNIVYKTGKKIKENDILDKLKENDEYLLPYSYYSQHKIKRIEETIRELLIEKGLASGEVRTEENKMGKNELEIVFHINEGSKIKVGEIEFEGKPKLRDSTLRGSFKENKKHSLLAWITGKDSLKINKLNEDIANLKRKYQEEGYMEAVIGEPRIEDITKRSIFLKKKTMKKIVVPVDAGYRYFVGDVKIEGNKIISTKFIRSLIKFQEGDVYSTKIREDAVEKIREIYGDIGYIFAQTMPVENLDPKHKRVNVTFNIYEGEAAYLHRLNIRGNTFTKDKVIRREILIREGDRFSFSFFKNSLLRMNQLGLVELQGEPEFNPNPEDPTQIDVTLNVQELQRNNIQFTAGYSGYQGTFVALSYSTVNFLGAGESLNLMLQHGKRIKNYSFGFTEPYVFDMPINVGFNLHNTYTVYPYIYTRKGKGADIIFGARLFGYWRANVTYGYENVLMEPPEIDEEDPYYDPYYNPYYGSAYNPYYYTGMYGFGQRYNVSSITTSLYRSTIDSPLTPSRGTMYMASLKYAGGPLGGDIRMVKPKLSFTHYRPLIKNHVFGFHVEYQFIKTLGGSEVPFWEKFYLGGEQSIRGYEIYTIGPRNESGYNLGGEKSLVLNAEYIIPLGGPIYAIFFYDMGNAYTHDQKINFKDMYSSAGLEMRIFVPALRVPFRLIFSYNNRKIRTDSNFAFRFAIGTTF